SNFSLTQFRVETILPYIILSHIWGVDTKEVTFKDLINSTSKDKSSYIKIRFIRE
ncbi:hypothetical protein CC78DRAFT_471288, partial [Lojkania enalia]